MKGAPYFGRYGREQVSKPAVSLKKSWGATVERLGGCTHSTHGRSLETIDPRIRTMPGRSMSDFHCPGRHGVPQTRSAVRCSASRMNGELHPTNNYL